MTSIFKNYLEIILDLQKIAVIEQRITQLPLTLMPSIIIGQLTKESNIGPILLTNYRLFEFYQFFY